MHEGSVRALEAVRQEWIRRQLNLTKAAGTVVEGVPDDEKTTAEQEQNNNKP